MTIDKVPNRQLLEWNNDWVKKWHYEPCEPYPSPPFSQHEIENEMYRRMKDFDNLDNRWSQG